MLLEDICDSESDTDSDEEAQEVDEQDMFKKILKRTEESSHASNDIEKPFSLNESGELPSSHESETLLESKMTAVFESSELT